MSQSDSQGTQEQGFLSHLFELRDRLLRVVLAVGIVFVILMPFAQDLYALFASPLTAHVETMLADEILQSFLIPYKLALLIAFAIALPYVLYQVWGFVAPGLYQHEKRLVTPLILSSVFLFYLGMAFAYFVVLPMIFKILPNFIPSNVELMPNITDYLDFTMMMFLAFGVGFEMPIATILIISSGMMTREDLAKSRPYVVVIAFIVGMFLTPPDVISQIMLAIPMWLLFEIGLITSRFFDKRIASTAAEREAMEAEDREQADREVAEAERNDTENTQLARSQTAAATRAGDDVEEPLAWEEERYSFREVDSDAPKDAKKPASGANHKPLSPEEMDAELDRIEAEQAIQAAIDAQARAAAAEPAPTNKDPLSTDPQDKKE